MIFIAAAGKFIKTMKDQIKTKKIIISNQCQIAGIIIPESVILFCKTYIKFLLFIIYIAFTCIIFLIYTDFLISFLIRIYTYKSINNKFTKIDLIRLTIDLLLISLVILYKLNKNFNCIKLMAIFIFFQYISSIYKFPVFGKYLEILKQIFQNRYDSMVKKIINLAIFIIMQTMKIFLSIFIIIFFTHFDELLNNIKNAYNKGDPILPTGCYIEYNIFKKPGGFGFQLFAPDCSPSDIVWIVKDENNEYKGFIQYTETSKEFSNTDTEENKASAKYRQEHEYDAYEISLLDGYLNDDEVNIYNNISNLFNDINNSKLQCIVCRTIMEILLSFLEDRKENKEQTKTFKNIYAHYYTSSDSGKFMQILNKK